MITVNITDKEPVIVSGLIQWDYGQKLQIAGLNLPETVEIHFSLTENCGNRVPSIGYTVDGITEVDVPDFILQNESEDACHFSNSYYAYAFVYVANGETGTTERKITLDIERSPKPSTNVPEDQKDKFLQEVRQVMAETKEVAQSVRDDADNGKFNGPQGDPGKSAYQYAVEGGFEGTEQEFIDLMAQAGQVDLTGYVSKEEHEAELLKTMVKVTTDKASFHHITDSANYRVLDFGMSGITEQETTPGNQLFDVDRAKNPDNWELGLYNYLPLNLPAGDYSLSFSKNIINKDTQVVMDNTIACYVSPTAGNPTNAKVNVGSYNVNSNISKLTYSFTINEGEELYINIFTNSSGATKKISQEVLSLIFDELLLDTMLNTGSTAQPYEPFTNGPSPNPDYPQEIKLAGVYNEETGRYEHKCCVGNKNWFDESKLSNGEFVEFNGVRCYKYTDGKASTITYDGFFALNTQYTITIRIYRESDDVTKNSYLVAEYTDGTSQNIKCVPNETTIFTSPTDKSIKRITSLPYYGLPAYLDLSVMQIEVDTSATAHVQHASQPFTLTSDRPLTMWDPLVKRDGVYGWSIWAKTKEFTGNEDVTTLYQDDTGLTIYQIYVENIPQMYNSSDYYRSYCEKFYWIPGNKLSSKTFTQKTCYSVQRRNFVQFASLTSDGIFESADTFKEYLKNEKVRIIYRSDTEQAFIPLPDEEQTLLHNLETYYGVTNVYNEQGCPMWFKYCTDQELHWNQKLLQIQQAII